MKRTIKRTIQPKPSDLRGPFRVMSATDGPCEECGAIGSPVRPVMGVLDGVGGLHHWCEDCQRDVPARCEIAHKLARTSAREANPCAKSRPVERPYEVWVSGSGPDQWTWHVLKKYQSPTKEAANPQARWFTAVKSPYTYGQWELGDSYVIEVKSGARLVERDIPEDPASDA